MSPLNQQQLPVGSIVKIQKEELDIAIIGQFPIVENNGKKGYYDFMGALLPIGYDSKNILFFNKEDIDSVQFVGFVNSSFQSFLKQAQDFEKDTQLTKLKSLPMRSRSDEKKI